MCGPAAYAELIASASSAVAPALAASHVSWRGQVASRRPLHRRMLFLSLRGDGFGPQQVPEDVEVLVREAVLGADAMRRARASIRAGDVVLVEGKLERPEAAPASCLALSPGPAPAARPVLVAERIAIVGSWATLRPGLTFSPFDATLPPCCAGGSPAPDRAQLSPLELEAAAVTRPRRRLEAAAPHRGAGSDAAAPRAPPAPLLPSARFESWFEGVPLHRLCRFFITSGESSGSSACQRRACGQLHSLDDFLVPGGARDQALLGTSPALASSAPPPPLRFAALKTAWCAWRQRCRVLGQLPQDGDAAVARLPGPEREQAIDNRACHGQRAAALVAWLVRTVPAALLERGVLDVAGGRGDVAFRLATLGGFPTTTVDPRPQLPRKQMKKFWRTRLDCERPLHLQSFFGAEFVADPAHAELLGRVGLVLGFHPDEATEAIVDFVIASGKPFVLVPCCVFAGAFPDRKLADGADVTSFEQFVVYLREKLKRGGVAVATSFLDYNGRNLVLSTPFPTEQ